MIIDRKELLNNTLKIFKIKGEVASFTEGASITRYEVKIEPSQDFSKLAKQASNIGVALGSFGQVRIEPLAGRSYIVGVEVPNETNKTIPLNDLLQSNEFKTATSTTSFIVGTNIDNQVIIRDIKKMPHLLIAGETGSGKSVFLNDIIISLISKSTSKEVKLILIDPKRTEMAAYKNVPHLCCPIIKDAKEALKTLNWAADEMDKRFSMFEGMDIRDYDEYEEKAKIDNLELPPRLVIVIDELSDLMMVSKKSKIDNNATEDLIIRLAQKARASGIHLIIATQYPKAEVVTGLIKANMPSRVAFRVASGTNSKVILDTTGAETLLGKGDMLFSATGEKTERIQGAFVSNDEVKEIVSKIKVEEPEYDVELMKILNTKEETQKSIYEQFKTQGMWEFFNNFYRNNYGYELSEVQYRYAIDLSSGVANSLKHGLMRDRVEGDGYIPYYDSDFYKNWNKALPRLNLKSFQ